MPIIDSNAITAAKIVTKEEWEKHSHQNDIHVFCICGSDEHQFHFKCFPEDNEVFMSVHLPDRGFLSRLWHGLKYIFGYKSKYGEFDEVLIGSEYADDFRRIADILEQKFR